MKKGEGVSHGISCHWDTRVTALPASGSGLTPSPFGPSLHIHLSLPGPQAAWGAVLTWAPLLRICYPFSPGLIQT